MPSPISERNQFFGNNHGAHVESACVDLAAPGYLVSKNFVGKEYVKVLHLVTLSWDVFCTR